MNDNKTTYIYSSPVDRVVETSEIFQGQLRKIGIDTRLKIRDTFGYMNNEKYYPKKVLDEWIKKSKISGKTENEFVKDFLDGKRETKPVMLAKNYLIDMEKIFERAINKKNKISIVSFRHGDKDKDGKLNENGKIQAKKLGDKIGENIDEYKGTIFIATHNTINESIVRCLVSDENLPNKRREPLNFAETVKYTFYPQNGTKKPYLKIEWRDEFRDIEYEEFKKLMKDLKK